MICGGMINYMEQLDNMRIPSGTFASGFNATAFLEPGHNKLEIWSSPIFRQDKVYEASDQCEVRLFGNFPSGKQEEMSSLTVTVEDRKPTIKTSTIYPDYHQTPLTDVAGVTYGYLTEFSRDIYIKTIPRWRWVDATPITEDSPREVRKALYRAYSTILKLMEARDYQGLEMAWSLSSREKARKGWEHYELETFMDGRLVRLKDSQGRSPLQIVSKKNDVVHIFTPYFSMIDSRVVVSR